MSAKRTIASIVDFVALHHPKSIALISPFEKDAGLKLTYKELSTVTNALASWLSVYGFEMNDLLVSDLPNTSENLILQIACNRLGVGYGTVPSIEQLPKFQKVQGAVCANNNGFLADINLPLPYLDGEFLQGLIQQGLDGYDINNSPLNDGDETTPHGFYNSTTAYTNEQALEHGFDAKEQLSITDNDKVCVSVTLCHAFGMGSAVCGALTSGAAVVLPTVGGLHGCGVPTERAEATLQVLEDEKCTLLFADTHTLKALPEPNGELFLRGGAVKTSSGSKFLNGTVEYAGVKLRRQTGVK
jgi:acyl-CoA synthetase (AMP-forming)/AMP-acid ligase II